jgi:hypothetical protein
MAIFRIFQFSSKNNCFPVINLPCQMEDKTDAYLTKVVTCTISLYLWSRGFLCRYLGCDRLHSSAPLTAASILTDGIPGMPPNESTAADDVEQNFCGFYNPDYIIYSSLGSFYIPCLVMVVLYTRIFRVIVTRHDFLSFPVQTLHARAAKAEAAARPAMRSIPASTVPAAHCKQVKLGHKQVRVPRDLSYRRGVPAI